MFDTQVMSSTLLSSSSESADEHSFSTSLSLVDQLRLMPLGRAEWLHVQGTSLEQTMHALHALDFDAAMPRLLSRAQSFFFSEARRWANGRRGLGRI